MQKRFYFDTSIWLDFFENRNEPNFPKGDRARELVRKIIKEGGCLIMSEAVKNEMLERGYSRYDIENMLFSFRRFIVNVYSTKRQFGKARDLSKKRNIPLFDALHALIARDNQAIMVTRDHHFDKILDIIKYKKPEELI